MKMILKGYGLRTIAALGAVIAPVSAFAVVPTYISDALTTAQATFVDYITAAAPMVFALVTIIAALFLVVKLVKRAAG